MSEPDSASRFNGAPSEPSSASAVLETPAATRHFAATPNDEQVLGLQAARLLLALMTGALTATMVSGFVRDPVEVVGVPLRDGYAEAAESMGWLCFVVMTALAGFLLARTAALNQWLERSGPVALAIATATLGFTLWSGRAVPGIALAATLAFSVEFVRRIESRLAVQGGSLAFGSFSRIRAFGPLSLAVIALPIAVTGRLDPVVVSVPLVVALLSGSRWIHPAARRGAIDARSAVSDRARFERRVALVSITLIGIGVICLTDRMQLLAAAGTAAALGACLIVDPARSRTLAAGTLAIALASLETLSESDLPRALGSLLAGVSLGVVVSRLVNLTWNGSSNISSARDGNAPIRIEVALPAIVVALAIGSCCLRPAAGIPLLLLGLIDERRRHFLTLAVITAGLVVAFPPTVPAPVLDPFHDGQILSALAEVRAGRPLMSEVFPLRGVDFFVGWIATWLAPLRFETVKLAEACCSLLSVPGAAAMVWSWRRSPALALAGGAAVAGVWSQEARIGCQLIAAAGALTAIRTDRVRWLIPTGMFAAAGGFDVWTPVAFGVAVGTLARVRQYGASDFGFAARRLAAAFVALTVPWTLLLATTQGFAAGFDYWRLLSDFMRHYPAYFGLPTDWSDGRHRMSLLLPIVPLTLILHQLFREDARLAPARRAMLGFLGGWLTLLAQRGLGRSDVTHLSSITIPSMIVTLLLADRLTGRFAARTRRAVLGLAAVAALFASPRGDMTVSRFLADARVALAGPEAAALTPDPEVLRRVPADRTLWDLEDGLTNAAHDRRNPTRHALSYCIGTPAEYRRALADLEARPPALIHYRAVSRQDGFSPMLRHYPLAEFVFTRYRPGFTSRGANYLVEAESDAPFPEEVPAPWAGPLKLGWIAHAWGERWPATLTVRNHRTEAPAWPWSPREWNLVIVTIDKPSGGAPGVARARFASPNGPLDDDGAVSWMVASGRHDYVLPLLCSPNWSWRRLVERLEIEPPPGASVCQTRWLRVSPVR